MALSGRVLVVDDFVHWRSFLRSTLQKEPGLHIIAEVSDGVQAVQAAEELKPDLIVLDIGLPKMNGLEVSRQIRKSLPEIKIVFFSEIRSLDIVEEALRISDGYVIKADAQAELLPAIKCVLRGRRFLSSTLGRGKFDTDRSNCSDKGESLQVVSPLPALNVRVRHELQLYANDSDLADGFARLIGSVLRVQNLAILVATELHRDEIFSRLRAAELDVDRAIEQGSYLALDASEILSAIMENGMPNAIRCQRLVSDVLTSAKKQAKIAHGRIAICAECAPRLLASGSAAAAIRLEHLWDEITAEHGADTLCGYTWGCFRQDNRSIFQQICAELGRPWTRTRILGKQPLQQGRRGDQADGSDGGWDKMNFSLDH